MDQLASIFNSEALLPHGICLMWQPALLLMHAISDSIIALSYFSIPAALAYFVLKRRDTVFPSLFALFALFIMGCGATHALGVWTLWHPDYGVDGVVKAFTALVSIGTATMLWRIMPQALMLPSPRQLALANSELARAVDRHQAAERRAQEFADELERRVTERTAELEQRTRELERLNAALHAEIRARERAEAELIQSRAELAHMNRVMTLGELAASIAHEIGQPLAAITTYASAATRWLDATPPDLKEAQQSLARIRDSVQRAADVTARIRMLAKKSPIQTMQVDINETVASVLGLIQREIDRNRITIRSELEDAVPAVQGDPVQLQQLVLNLLMNAIDAMADSEARDLFLRTRYTDDKVRVSVFDSGCGLEPGATERLFDAFYTTKPGGMGMGLAICRSIIRSHDGQLSARGNEPCGAVFEFELPLRKTPGDTA